MNRSSIPIGIALVGFIIISDQLQAQDTTQKPVPAIARQATDSLIPPEGRTILLRPDGTWRWVGEEPVKATAPAVPDPADVAVVRGYLAADTWEQRLKFVMDSAKVRPLMAKYYENYSGPTTFSRIISSITGNEKVGGWVTVKVVGGGVGPYYLKLTPDGWKIDWISSIGVNPTSLTVIRASTVATPVRLRVNATLFSDYTLCTGYQYEISVWRLQVSDGKGSEFVFVPKESAEGRAIYDVLKDGDQHRMVLDIRIATSNCGLRVYDGKPYAKGGSITTSNLTISKVIAIDTWRVDN